MSQALLLSDPVPSVSIHNGRPAVTSLDVSKFFEKRHGNVVRDIAQIVSNSPKKFSRLNFELASYLDEQAKNRPMYIIYRDGFMLLVMGYTGKKALAIKLAYIEAFNAMEEELARRSRPALAADPFPCSVEECRRLMREIDDLYAGKRNDLEHLKDRLVEVTFNVTHTLLRKYRIPFTAGGEGPGLHSTIHQCLFSMLCEGFSMRRPGLYEGFNPGWHLLGIMSQIEKGVRS
ncbi:Rha family transcriptional regulator [Bilophila wadsworthia]|uniref:Rha family transcriptional regulator n=1 Tax=Bilophila wadsworthia TaxID=35833 RepID=UPI0032208637